MMPLDILTKCHHKIWKCHQPFSTKSYKSCPDSTSVFSQMASVCFCKWSQTFINGASRHLNKMPPQDLKMPSAIIPQTTTSHVHKGQQVSTNCHRYISLNVSTLFVMVALDTLTKCQHKIWKCHHPFFHIKLQVMPWFNISFQPNGISVFLQMIPDF